MYVSNVSVWSVMVCLLFGRPFKCFSFLFRQCIVYCLVPLWLIKFKCSKNITTVAVVSVKRSLLWFQQLDRTQIMCCREQAWSTAPTPEGRARTPLWSPRTPHAFSAATAQDTARRTPATTPACESPPQGCLYKCSHEKKWVFFLVLASVECGSVSV